MIENNILCLNNNFSTTRCLIKKQPVIENKLEDKFQSVLFLPKGKNRKYTGGLRTKGYFKIFYDEKPLISIITAVYNGEQFLEKTIQSVINQTYNNIEYIIIDGGSTDGTLNIIKKYEDKIDYIVSESDNGIGDAFNKGIRCVSGNYINFLNAGDYFLDNSIIYSNLKYFKKKYTIITSFVKFGNITIPRYKLNNSMPLYKKARISHQASFVAMQIFKDKGLFDTNIEIRMDYEFWMRILNDYNFLFIPEIMIYYDDNGVSSNNIDKFYNEELQINNKYLNIYLNIFRKIQIYIIRQLKQ